MFSIPSFVILGAALLAQSAATLLSLRMFRTYGRRPLWLLLTAASLAAAAHSVALLLHPGLLVHSGRAGLPAELSAMTLSLALAVGLGGVDGLFRERLQSEEALEREKRRLSMLVDRRVADLETEVAERTRAEDALRQDGERFSAIIATQYDIATADRDSLAVMDLIVARTQTLTGASGAILQRVEGDELVYRAASGRAKPFLGTRTPRDAGLCGECVRTGTTLRCDDAERDGRVDLEHCRRMGTRSTVAVPLHYDRAVVGVLQVTSPELYAFGPMDEHTLHLMAGLIAAAMSHAAEFEAKQELLAHKEHLLAEAREQADRDPLTGLLNHRAFHKKLEEEADRAHRTGERVALAVIDLDNFKFFNDAYGHLVGDEVLAQVGQAIARSCRSYDTAARYGGDEFALLLPGVGDETVEAITARLDKAFESLEYRPAGEGGAIPLSLSLGVSVFPEDGPGRLDALETADARLLRTKYGGGLSDALTAQMRSHLNCSMANFSMLNALVTAVDTKDRYTRRHSEDVMFYSHQIACALGLPEDECNLVLTAALLHDVGKIGVPNYILRKPGKLTDEEYKAVKQHPMMGAVIVGAVAGLENTLDAIRHHHERWDGKGYPYGLRGEEIPPMARLMAVADAYSALTTDRPYRKGMAEGKAQAILEDGAGTQWDPACVEAFLRARRAAPPALLSPSEPPSSSQPPSSPVRLLQAA